jgi:predicted  nucleic acid-binding Zn-ribbon protein
MGEQTTRLTMLATAAGFDTSARAVDILADAEKQLTENSKQLEQAKLTGALAEVDALQQRQQSLEKVIDGVTSSQGRSTASHRDWFGVLRSINPQLGAYVEEMFRAGKVTRELASQKQLLSSIGAAAIPVFVAIAATVRAMAAEYAEATQAIRDQAKALDELKKQERDQQQTIEDARAKTKLGPFSAEQSQRALETFQQVREKFPFVAEDAVKNAIAFTGGAAGERGGGAHSLEDIARLARLIQLGPTSLSLTQDMKPASVEREITQELNRHKQSLDQQFATEAAQAAERASRVPVEVAQQGGSTLNLRERLQRRAGEGMNVDHLVELAQKIQDLGGLEEFDRLLQMAISGESPSLHVLRRLSQGAGLLGIDAGALDPRLTATESELAVLRGLFVELLAESKKQTEALQNGKGVVHIGSYQPNAKNFGADAFSFRRRSINGESRASDAEE